VLADDLPRAEQSPVPRRHAPVPHVEPGLEQHRQVLLGDAAAGVLNPHLHAAVQAAGGQHHAPLALDRFQRIAQQVGEHCAELLRAAHERRKRLQPQFKAHPSPRLRLEQRHDVRQKPV